MRPFHHLVTAVLLIGATLPLMLQAGGDRSLAEQAPRIVPVDLGSLSQVANASASERAAMAKKVVDRVVEQADRTASQWVVIGVNSLPFSYESLPSKRQQVIEPLGDAAAGQRYESVLAGLLERILQEVKARRPNLSLSVLGLPVEPQQIGLSAAREANQRYDRVIAQLDAFVTAQTFTRAEFGQVNSALPEARRLRHGRPILFRVEEWMTIDNESTIIIGGRDSAARLAGKEQYAARRPASKKRDAARRPATKMRDRENYRAAGGGRDAAPGDGVKPRGGRVAPAQKGAATARETSNLDDRTQGWTEHNPGSGTRIVYVSSSDGNDLENGLSPDRPVRTLHKAKQLVRHGHPDWLLLKRGDVWSESLGHWKKSGRSAAEPLLISSYGDAPARPLLQTGSDNGFRVSGGGGSPATIDNVALVGLHFEADSYDGSSGAAGISWILAGSSILIEDCHIDGYATGIVIRGHDAPIHNFAVRRNVVADAHAIKTHSQGIYAYNTHGLLIEECVIDHNGWKEDVPGAEKTIFNHNIYIQTNCTEVTVRGNIIANAASHGIQLRPGGLIEDNLWIRNPIAILVGGGTRPAIAGVTGTVRGNVILEGTNISDQQPRGVGLQIVNINANGLVVEDNIFAHNLAEAGRIAVSLDPAAGSQGVGVNNVTFRNNVLYDWGRLRINKPVPGRPVSGCSFADNVIQDPFGSTALVQTYPANLSGVVFSGNTYASGARLSQWFWAGQAYSLNDWRNLAEPSADDAATTFVDSDRTVATYAGTLRLPATYEAFMEGARLQSRFNWQPEFTAQAVLKYLRAGFEKQDTSGRLRR